MKIWTKAFCRKLATIDILTNITMYVIILMKTIYGGIYNEKDYLQKNL